MGAQGQFKQIKNHAHILGIQGFQHRQWTTQDDLYGFWRKCGGQSGLQTLYPRRYFHRQTTLNSFDKNAHLHLLPAHDGDIFGYVECRPHTHILLSSFHVNRLRLNEPLKRGQDIRGTKDGDSGRVDRNICNAIIKSNLTLQDDLHCQGTVIPGRFNGNANTHYFRRH